MTWKPNKWIAAALGLFLPPVGMLYVARPQWAAFYLIVLFASGAVNRMGQARISQRK